LRIVPDGIYYACGLTVVGLAASYFLNSWLAAPCYLLAVFCLYFFRDPERIAPAGELLVSPADGKVVSIQRLTPQLTRISVFLNIFNVHVNRTPVPGRISEVLYQQGKFLVASHEAASTENEQNTLVLQTVVRGKPSSVICRQIAGLIARRIVCYKQPGDTVEAGERIGYIKFGSRMDIIFGPEWKHAVKVGDKVSAGTSILARPAEAGEIA
jgi:phosphatidylserine decarboxylase